MQVEATTQSSQAAADVTVSQLQAERGACSAVRTVQLLQPRYLWCWLLLAGLPLTDSRLSGAYAVLTANDPDSVNWDAYRHIPTLVILMGARALPIIVHKLQGTGWRATTPVSNFMTCLQQCMNSSGLLTFLAFC